jgi:hypothetical protein
MKMLTSSKFRSFELCRSIIDDIDSVSDHYEDLKKIIHANILSNVYMEDSIRIASLLNYFDESFAEILAAIWSSRRSYLLKLEILDYMIYGIGYIPKSVYFKISECYLGDNNILLRFQARINLVAYGRYEHLNYLLDPANYEYPFFYYRMINMIIDIKQISSVFMGRKDELKQMLNHSTVVTTAQRAELCKMLE